MEGAASGTQSGEWSVVVANELLWVQGLKVLKSEPNADTVLRSRLLQTHECITAICRYIAAAFCDTAQRMVKAAGFYLGAQLQPVNSPSPPASA